MALIRGSEGLLAHCVWTPAGNTGRKGGPPPVCGDLLLGQHAERFVYLVAFTFSTPVQERTHPVGRRMTSCLGDAGPPSLAEGFELLLTLVCRLYALTNKRKQMTRSCDVYPMSSAGPLGSNIPRFEWGCDGGTMVFF